MRRHSAKIVVIPVTLEAFLIPRELPSVDCVSQESSKTCSNRKIAKLVTPESTLLLPERCFAILVKGAVLELNPVWLNASSAPRGQQTTVREGANVTSATRDLLQMAKRALLSVKSALLELRPL